MNTQTTQENKDQHSLIFDRQMRIEGWDQAALSKQVVLCLGVGGLGSCVAINLLRLGVKKIILIDYDKVDIHNLNRQVLYSKEDVGKYKIDAALKNLQMHNVGDTIIEGHNMDALKNWSKIVQMARECTAVINMIDWGEYFDVAVQALCLHLKLPFIMGGTFAASLSVDAFGPHAKPCFLCLTDGIKKDVLEKIMPDKIADIEDLTFLPKDNNPIGQSNIFLCNTCANFMTSMFINYTFKDPFVENPKRILFYVNSFESVIFPAEPSPNCVFCKSLEPPEPPKTEGEGESKPVDTEAETKADLSTEVPTEISHEGKTE